MLERLDAGLAGVLLTREELVLGLPRALGEEEEPAGRGVAGELVDALGDDLPDRPFPALLPMGQDAATAPSPIRLGPGLLVFLDRLRRENFIRAWEASMLQ